MMRRLTFILSLLVWTAMAVPAAAEGPETASPASAPQCLEAPATDAALLAPTEPAPAGGLVDPLAEAFQAAGPYYCSSHSDCPCQPPGCYCTPVGRCLCNYNICCFGEECP